MIKTITSTNISENECHTSINERLKIYNKHIFYNKNNKILYEQLKKDLIAAYSMYHQDIGKRMAFNDLLVNHKYKNKKSSLENNLIETTIELQCLTNEWTSYLNQIDTLIFKDISEKNNKNQSLYTIIAIVIATASFFSSAIFFCLEYFKH
jgi:hypothetical protein